MLAIMFCVNSTVRVTRPLIRQLGVSSTACFHNSSPFYKAQTMKQVDVDEADIQNKLGKLIMDFVRKAERTNLDRAKRHKFFRRKDFIIAFTCFCIVIGIYSYTMFAIQQEKFLDDFEMPEDIDITEEDD
jgi:hypothetical protein